MNCLASLAHFGRAQSQAEEFMIWPARQPETLQEGTSEIVTALLENGSVNIFTSEPFRKQRSKVKQNKAARLFCGTQGHPITTKIALCLVVS